MVKRRHILWAREDYYYLSTIIGSGVSIYCVHITRGLCGGDAMMAFLCCIQKPIRCHHTRAVLRLSNRMPPSNDEYTRIVLPCER